ncbi:MAG: hypothetical protein RR359_05635 [Bacilli bacterium]
MEIKQEIKFSESDLELLSKILPNIPCKECLIDSFSCNGCDELLEYNKYIKPYEDNNMYEIALKLKELDNKNKSIKMIRDEQNCILNELPKDIRYWVFENILNLMN